MSLDKDKTVNNLIVEEEGVRKIKWNWRRNLFQWEEDLVEACNDIVLRIGTKREEEDRWLWGKDNYTDYIAFRSRIPKSVFALAVDVKW
ncbi:hypothetical protein TSUD_145230 [Trifolium subterraneum]|uniref:Reverse transcriptase zinc-binding domain-containing protein n=1 Tax=Trifolium subterraneum TaxID=3900 RepID=A0A2Z6N2I1_TRISU|nr:hypothetical protein TSUD_145230 [Trifolium subterraneum]